MAGQQTQLPDNALTQETQVPHQEALKQVSKDSDPLVDGSPLAQQESFDVKGYIKATIKDMLPKLKQKLGDNGNMSHQRQNVANDTDALVSESPLFQQRQPQLNQAALNNSVDFISQKPLKGNVIYIVNLDGVPNMVAVAKQANYATR